MMWNANRNTTNIVCSTEYITPIECPEFNMFISFISDWQGHWDVSVPLCSHSSFCRYVRCNKQLTRLILYVSALSVGESVYFRAHDCDSAVLYHKVTEIHFVLWSDEQFALRCGGLRYNHTSKTHPVLVCNSCPHSHPLWCMTVNMV
jgi:hypothetical protein